jgi:hypothetical protein
MHLVAFVRCAAAAVHRRNADSECPSVRPGRRARCVVRHLAIYARRKGCNRVCNEFDLGIGIENLSLSLKEIKEIPIVNREIEL